MAALNNPGLPAAPLVDNAGNLTPVWLNYFAASGRIGAATAGSVGVTAGNAANPPGLSDLLTAETATRAAADATLSTSLSGEVTRATAAEGTNATAISTETTNRAAADALLAPLAAPALTGIPTAPTAAVSTNTTQLATTAFTTAAVGVETTRATTAEALLVSIAGLLTQFAALNLSSLPTADPGSGKPWLNSGALWVGAVVVRRILKEDGSGVVQLESGSGSWDFS